MKHTPGPWELNPAGEPVIRWGDDGGQYAVLEPDEMYDGWKTDARLIAAAPDLLEACRLAITALSQHDELVAFRAAEKAIAKAEVGR